MDFVNSILFSSFVGTPGWMWLTFLAIVIALLIFDLGIFHREHREMSVRDSIVLSTLYIGLALVFGAGVWWQLGPTAGMDYLTGFALEKALAIDNVFVIAMIFGYLAIPAKYQHRVLFWGIIGVIVLRAIMIGAGTAIVTQFAWVQYLFAVFLIATGIKMLVMKTDGADLGSNPALKFMRRRFNLTSTVENERFFVRKPDPTTGRSVLFATPLFVALVLVELADVIFAIDSVPAILAITSDPFIVYTSNIFAILGLRALYFALAAMVDRFHYLKYALALVLVFIGAKIFIADMLGVAKIPSSISLGVTLGILVGGVVVSLVKTRKPATQSIADRA